MRSESTDFLILWYNSSQERPKFCNIYSLWFLSLSNSINLVYFLLSTVTLFSSHFACSEYVGPYVGRLCSMFWIGSREIFNCADYLYVFVKCLLPSLQMAGANDRHLYHNNDTSSDTEDYTDERRRRVFKNRMR